ncbi:hypothetical protein EON83_27075 [bacterium]|nr:MAG: hypothetical protein EON83_27075 [bacterium]
MLPIVLLVISNIFMTVAWYGHLKHPDSPLRHAIFTSWGLAFFEYVFQVPANRIGSHLYTVTQLKIMQEAITLCVFTIFAFFVFHEKPKPRNLLSYGCIVAAVYFAFRK